MPVEVRKGKRGTSYRLIVNDGFDSRGKRIRHQKKFEPAPGLTEKQAMKAANKAMVEFEQQIRQGYAVDEKITFSEYVDQVLETKQIQGLKHKTLYEYKSQKARTNQAIGHLILQEIRPAHLMHFYKNLMESGIRETSARAVPKVAIRDKLREKGLSMAKAAKLAGIAESTVNAAGKGTAILAEKAQKLAEVMGIPVEELFELKQDTRPLANTTVLAYHRFIHTILEHASKEMLVTYNAADKVYLPKKNKSKVDTLQLEEVTKILEIMEKEPLKWQMVVHMLMITGCRRGEILGLKWKNVYWDSSAILIDNNLLYTPDRGIYEDTTKTGEDRIIKLPGETVELLKKYHIWQDEYRMACGDRWEQSDFVFTAEYGGPMAPDTLSGYLQRLEAKHNLPHIHAHIFRHSLASLLYFSGVDPVSISKRLGHAQVSTTQDMYAHLIKEADTQSAEKIAEAIFRKG